MSKHIKKLASIALLAVWTMVFSVAGLAQSHPVEGSYNVAATSSELGTMNFTLTIKRDAGKWAAEIKDSPTPLSVTNVTVDESNKVTITADAGGTGVTIAGKFAENKIAGDWSAGDIKGTWTATKAGAMAAKPAEKPAGGGASAGAGLEGTYEAKVIADGQGELPFTLIIKRDGNKLVTTVENGGDLNVTGIEVKDGDIVNLTATYQGNGPIPLSGKRNGNEMGGKWEFSGFSGTWSAKKKN